MSQCPDVPTAICIEISVSQMHLLSAVALLATSEAGGPAAGADCLPGPRHRAGAGGGSVCGDWGRERGQAYLLQSAWMSLYTHVCAPMSQRPDVSMN